jgi:cytochrome P450
MPDATGFFDAAPMQLDRTDGWRYFRDRGAVYEAGGLWYLTSTEAVRFAHHNPHIFSSARAFDSLGSPVPLIPLAIDPPDHVRYRRVLDPMLAPRVINSMEDELRRQIQVLLDAFIERGRCEVNGDIGRLYPTQVILTLFGLPIEDRDQFIKWVDVLVNTSGAQVTGATPEQMEAGLALFTYLQDYIEKKRSQPSDDMLSRVLALAGEDAWTDEEVLGLCFLFTLAGLDTVTSAIGFVLYHLARRRDLQQRINSDPSMIDPLIEEVLRLELPAPLTPRAVQEDVTVEGVTIPAGSMAFLCLATANREIGDHPDDIDLGLAARAHLSFGGGIHRCLGSHLARRELRLVVEEFHKRIPEYRIESAAQPRAAWPSGTLHLESVHLAFEPA